MSNGRVLFSIGLSLPSLMNPPLCASSVSFFFLNFILPRSADAVSPLLLLHSATFCLTSISQSKNQAMFFNHFPDTLFHLADYNQVYFLDIKSIADVMGSPSRVHGLQHPLYNQQPQSTRERELFSLKGPNNRRYFPEPSRFIFHRSCPGISGRSGSAKLFTR